MSALQSAFAVSMAVLAGWQVSLWFSHRIETDFTALMNDSLLDVKWHPVYHEVSGVRAGPGMWCFAYR